MSIFYFEEIILKKANEELNAVEKVLASKDDNLRTATKNDFLNYKELLLEPIPQEEDYFMGLLTKHVTTNRLPNVFELSAARNASAHTDLAHISAISVETKLPIYILKNCILNIDSQYCADKHIASKYVDKLPREWFSSWVGNLPGKEMPKDILDLIVMVIIQDRGTKLEGKIRRSFIKILLQILGKYEK